MTLIIHNRKSALAGNKNAMINLADLYQQQDIEKAIEWYERAGGMKNACAKSKLTELYNKFPGFRSSRPQINKHKLSALNGDINAMKDLGIIYSRRNSINKRESIFWYQKAADTGDISAIRNIISYHRSDRHCMDGGKVRLNRWYQKVADISSEEALNIREGEGSVIPNLITEIKVNEEYAFFGDTSSMIKLGDCYIKYGDHLYEGLAWYKRAIDAGNTTAMIKVADLCCNEYRLSRSKGKEEAVKLYEKAANAGNVDAMLILVNLYSQGDVYGNPNYNLTLAIEWYKKAQQTGNTIKSSFLKYSICEKVDLTGIDLTNLSFKETTLNNVTLDLEQLEQIDLENTKKQRIILKSFIISGDAIYQKLYQTYKQLFYADDNSCFSYLPKELKIKQLSIILQSIIQEIRTRGGQIKSSTKLTNLIKYMEKINM
ncbi:MAG: tetratricopeptide repeat protein [Neisseriaceae bacterium]